MAIRIIIVLLSFLSPFLRPVSCVYPGETGRFRFVVIGCMDFGALDFKDYDLLAKKVKEYDPDFAVVLSDTIDTPEEKSMEISWQEFYRALGRSEIPVYDILNKERRTFEYENNLFILSLSENHDSLKKLFGDISRYKNVFVFSRQNPWFEKENGWAQTIPLLYKSKVRHIFGPNLQHLGLKKSNNNYIMSRSLPCYLKSYPESHFFHFFIVDADKDKASLEFVSLRGNRRPEQGALINRHVLLNQRSYPINSISQQRIIEALKIKPGMTILDIGAGIGFFTFPFAEAMRGTGRVFATDIAPEMVDYIRARKEESEYKNIFPVLVRPEGLDPFYKQHNFDIIFLCGVYRALEHPEDYFRQLRLSLKKGKGRLYITNFKMPSDFNEIDFSDFKKIIQALASRGKSFPVFIRLSKEARDFISNWQGEDIPARIREDIVQDINKMLSDSMLIYDLMNYYSAEEIGVPEDTRTQTGEFTMLSSRLKWQKWLIFFLRNFPGITKAQLIDSRSINKLLLTEALSVTELPGPKNEIAPPDYVTKDSVVSTLEASGYQFIREYGFLESHFFLEFKRRD